MNVKTNNYGLFVAFDCINRVTNMLLVCTGTLSASFSNTFVTRLIVTNFNYTFSLLVRNSNWTEVKG